MTYDRRLIEDSLPLEIISEQSAREKSIRHGHISTLHIWWARRPLAAMRAAIFASLIPAPKDEKEREYLHKLIGDIVNWDSVKDGNNARIEEARALIRKHYPDAPPKVLDPFMGGGSTGLEALRLGCEAHGVELNPVAYLIQLCTLVYPQKYGQPKALNPHPPFSGAEALIPQPLLPRGEGEQAPLSHGERGRGEGAVRSEGTAERQMPMHLSSADPIIIRNPLAEDVRRWGMWVLEEARKEIGHLYEDPEGRTIIAYLWARTAKCPNPMCGAEMPMVRQWWLAKTDRKRVAIRMNVDKTAKTVSFDVASGDAINFDPDSGTMRRGTIVCPVCGASPADDYLKAEGKAGRLGAALMAVVYDAGNGKGYRPPTDADRARFATARALLARRLEADPDALPYELIPSHSSRAIFVHLYGLERWGDLFNARQAVSIITFIEKVKSVYEHICEETGDENYAIALTTCLSLIVDRLADYNSTLCVWANSGEFIAHTFGRQALPMVWDYPELNPFGGGSGDWTGAIDWVARAIEHCAGASNVEATLRQGDASRLSMNDKFLDAVITDPPYYDAVPYSDLSDFFYVWQKRSVGNLYPELFATPATPKTPEIIQEPGRHNGSKDKSKQFYEAQMTKAFSEAARVLKPNGIFVVVFAHKSTAAWETLLNSLLSSSLVVSASWPLHTERPGRLRAHDSAALASSIFIVCRKRVAQEDGFYDDVRRELQERIAERLSFFWSQGIRGADFFISAIGPAVEVFGRHKAVRKLSGDVVSVADLLDLVQEAVADYTLSRVLNGRYKMGTVDAPTRFYVMYRWSYGSEKLLFDDARRLAQALGAEVSDLIRSGLLKQSGDSVTMPGANERKKQDHLGEAGRDGTVPPVIDVLHRAVLVWQNADRRALAEYLAQHALGREEEVSAVAQALVNVLPQGDRERQLLENYLQGSSDLPDAPRQSRLL
jgi:putative DNA methylase